MTLFFPDQNKFENSVVESWTPSIDFRENENEYIVNAELPGVSKEDISVDVQKNSLIISGETKQDEQYDDGNTYAQERRYGNFSRSISIPNNVKASDITATFEQGILEVKLPKGNEIYAS